MKETEHISFAAMLLHQDFTCQARNFTAKSGF
jgi:hypothetical protein